MPDRGADPGQTYVDDTYADRPGDELEREHEQLEVLETDELMPEVDEVGYDPPDRPSTPTAEQLSGDDDETIDDRLRQEEPEPDPYAERDPATEV